MCHIQPLDEDIFKELLPAILENKLDHKMSFKEAQHIKNTTRTEM